jgi:parvulin-like peptidyl-prolyl isomerase
VIEEEAFRLQPGELSGIISVADKYLILRCLGRTQPVVRDFAAVEGELRRDLLEKKMRLAMADEFDRLKEAAQIDNFLTGTSQPGKRATPAALPAAPRR